MKAAAIALLAALALPVAGPGCAAIVSSLPVILAGVQDGALLLSAIETFVNGVYRTKPDPARELIFRQSIAKCRTALDLVLRLATGVQKVDQAQIDAAFKDFEVAYLDLVSLVGPLGVHLGDVSAPRATPGGGLVVPRPLAVAPR